MHIYFLNLVEEKKWNNGKDSLFGFTIVHNTLKKNNQMVFKWQNSKCIFCTHFHYTSLNLGGLKFLSLGRKSLIPFSFFFFFSSTKEWKLIFFLRVSLPFYFLPLFTQPNIRYLSVKMVASSYFVEIKVAYVDVYCRVGYCKYVLLFWICGVGGWVLSVELRIHLVTRSWSCMYCFVFIS